jgi:hypothetical protein
MHREHALRRAYTNFNYSGSYIYSTNPGASDDLVHTRADPNDHLTLTLCLQFFFLKEKVLKVGV